MLAGGSQGLSPKISGGQVKAGEGRVMELEEDGHRSLGHVQ